MRFYLRQFIVSARRRRRFCFISRATSPYINQQLKYARNNEYKWYAETPHYRLFHIRIMQYSIELLYHRTISYGSDTRSAADRSTAVSLRYEVLDSKS